MNTIFIIQKVYKFHEAYYFKLKTQIILNLQINFIR